MSDVLGAIAAVVADRRDANPDTSYVASLNVKGIDKILEKESVFIDLLFVLMLSNKCWPDILSLIS